jgi:demethylmenaquinone methyltransferase/2-methoxy-6-polyprenyl-1,4-benzoquinol methylase
MPRPPSGRGWQERVAPVGRDTAAARVTYDRLAGVYDLVEAPFERRARVVGLRLLAARPGERVLEVGPGTGHTLVTLAGQVGPRGCVVGVDLSARMAARARRRLVHAGYRAGTAVVRGQAHRLPLGGGVVDAVTMSFVLDLIDTDQIPVVLAECRRVLRPGGRLALVALDLLDQPPAMARLYLWGHRHLPRLLDCRPIPVADLLAATGWQVHTVRHVSSAGLPVAAALATLTDATEGSADGAPRSRSRPSQAPADEEASR